MMTHMMDVDASKGNIGDGFRPQSPMQLMGRRGRRATDAEVRVEDDVWDWDAWQTIVADAQGRPFPSAYRSYQRFLEQFPTYARGWKQVIDHSIRHQRDAARISQNANNLSNGSGEMVVDKKQPSDDELKPESIFERAVQYCKTNVDLWRSYISWTRSQGNRDDTLNNLFDRALQNCGLEPSSHDIWSDYIAFFAQSPARNSVEEEQKRDRLRKIYQQAVKSPIQKLEILWRQYEEFENEGSNRDLARGIINEMSPLNMSARAEFRARTNRRDGLMLNAHACPPRGRPKEEEQSRLWRKYISAEKANPHKLEADELYKRVKYAHEMALVCLYRYPDAWIEASNYEIESKKEQEAESFLHRGLEALPSCALIHFALANLYELSDRNDEAKECYENLIQKAPTPLAYIQYMRFSRRTETTDAARQIFSRARKDKHCCTFQVFVAAAQVEYHVNKLPKIAKNVFELGMRLFPMSVDYAMEYISFLWHLNDDCFLRTLFERVISQIPKGVDSRPIWDKYVEFESTFGSAKTVDKIVKRRATTLAESGTGGDAVLNLISRTTSLDLIPVTYQEMNAIQARVTAPTSNARTETEKPDRNNATASAKEARNRDGGANSGADKKGAKMQSQPMGLDEGIMALVREFPRPQNQPPPEVDFILRLIMATPKTFAETPAGEAAALQAASGNSNPRKRKGSNAENGEAGDRNRREQGEAAGASNVVPPPVHRAPSRDLFRSRHAQKLSKLK